MTLNYRTKNTKIIVRLNIPKAQEKKGSKETKKKRKRKPNNYTSDHCTKQINANIEPRTQNHPAQHDEK